MTLKTLCDTIKRKSHRGDQATTSDNITRDIIASINEAMRDVSKLLPKRYWHKTGTPLALVPGVVGTPAVYSLASDCQEPLLFYYVDGTAFYNMRKVDSDREWIQRVWSPTAALGLPYSYREIGPDTNGYKQIEIFPVPSKNLSLQYEYYRTKTADRTSAHLSNELPDLPDHVQDAVEKGGLYYFLKGFDDPLGQIAKADYNEARMAMEVSDESDQDADLRLRWDITSASPYNTIRFQ